MFGFDNVIVSAMNAQSSSVDGGPGFEQCKANYSQLYFNSSETSCKYKNITLT